MPERVHVEHYDLIINGVELGGGSRRIHNDAALQRRVLEKGIRVSPEKIHQFDRLSKVLDSGRLPHAGIALGFGGLLAIMSGRESTRDVIAFPKNSKGVDDWLAH
jgi:aspartyl-tRNA synthetase